MHFFEGNTPYLLVSLVNCSILVSTLLVIFLSFHNLIIPLELANSPKNFPIGSLTATFSPDTQVFLDPSTWISWYALTLTNFAVFLTLFLILNSNLKSKKEGGIRFVFYSCVFLVLPFVANMLYVITTGGSSLGPSAAYYTSVGLLVGFGLVNLWAGDVSGGMRSMRGQRKEIILFVLNGMIGTGFLLLSLLNQTSFFSEVVAGFNVGYGIHIFCFYSAIILCLIYGYWRRACLVIPLQPSSIASPEI
jgi:hypothetical protein